jgi:hypothetical protein
VTSGAQRFDGAPAANSTAAASKALRRPEPVGDLAARKRARERAERDPARDDLDERRRQLELRWMPSSAPEMTPWS